MNTITPEDELPTLAIDPDGLRQLRNLYPGIETDKLLAQRLNLSVPTVNRVLKGKYAPGPRFLAAVFDAFGRQWVGDLIRVVRDDK